MKKYELYFFGMTEQMISHEKLHTDITNNSSLVLTQDRLFQHLLNINNINIDSLEKKEIYDYSDIKEIEMHLELQVIIQLL